MPTGYTADIQNDITFQQFALNCARAFGACISLRDEPIGTQIPEVFEPDIKYYNEGIGNLEKRIKRIKKMSYKDVDRLIKKEYNYTIKYISESKSKRDSLHQKYLNMLTEVKAWIPPSKDHENMKEFMISQIEQSIAFDCPDSAYTKPQIKSPKEYKVDTLKELTNSLEYYKKLKHEEIERCKARSQWVKQLRESLKGI